MYQGRFSHNDSSGTPPVQQPPQKKKRQASLGTTIFYTLYVFFILLFCAGTLYGLSWLNGWLGDFESSQPTAKAAAVFNQHFGNPQWEQLYRTAGIQDSRFENGDSFAAYMQERIQGGSLTYAQSPEAIPGTMQYDVLLGGERIAAFTLENRNPDPSRLAIPDWQFGTVELFYQRNQAFRIVCQEGHSVEVNGVPLQESDIFQITTTLAGKYLPSGVNAPRTCTLEVDGLFTQPEVAVFDQEGNPLAVSYDEASRTFTDAPAADPIPEDLEKAALKAAEYHALWLAAEVNDPAVLRTHFLEGTDTHKSILSATAESTPQDSSREFTDVTVSDYVRYDEDHFSLRVEMNLRVTQASGSVKDWPYRKSMIFQKQPGGKWLCIFATGTDLSQPVGRVRLTFMLEDTPVSSEFYHTEATSIITPVINAPEGKVFAGWVQHITDENGQTALELVFRPDSTGRVALPEGMDLTPMTLYAHYETLGGN